MATAVVKRLDEIIDSLPKEGYKAAVALGIVARIREIASAAVEASSLVECVAQGRGYCRDRICNPNCARVLLLRPEEGTSVIAKIRNGAGITLTPTEIRMAVKDYSLTIDAGGTARFTIPGGIEETVNLSNMEEVFRKGYNLRQVIRRVGRRVDNIVVNLRKCARASALVC